MSRRRAPAARGVRIAGGLEWPLVAGAVLGLLAVVEVVLRAGHSGARLSTALLLALAATVPLVVLRAQVWVAAGAITAANLSTLVAYQRPTGAGLVSLLVVFYMLGRERVRRMRAEAVERDASRQTIEDTLLEHAARGERARIARELHDVVAHHISMISVQAETARLATPGMPTAGARQLLAIGDTARTALTEMRRLLGVLREDADGDGVADRKPQPSLHQLNELVDEARDTAGGSVRLVVSGQVGPLDPGIELTAYRIVQEALTNARRHARGAAVDVEMNYTDAALHLRIRDNGPGPGDLAPVNGSPARGGGHGLLGMHERVTAVGGNLRIGPAHPAGFLVEATLPTSRSPAAGVAGVAGVLGTVTAVGAGAVGSGAADGTPGATG